MRDNRFILLGTIVLIGIFAVGYLSNDLYREYNYKRQFNGLWIEDVKRAEAENITNRFEEDGTWVCINVKDMSPEQMIETCNHEAGHELFARYCGENIDKCLEVIENE